jgi:hypothetical protein
MRCLSDRGGASAGQTSGFVAARRQDVSLASWPKLHPPPITALIAQVLLFSAIAGIIALNGITLDPTEPRGIGTRGRGEQVERSIHHRVAETRQVEPDFSVRHAFSPGDEIARRTHV